MTDIDYKPKHKRPPGFAGSTPRGPHRWARAAHNALTRPNTVAAQIYLDRVTRAHELRHHFTDPGPFSHFGWRYNRTYGGMQWKRKYSTCSLFCAAMVVQLDFGLHEYGVLVLFLQNNDKAPIHLDRKTLKTDVSCYCCGGKIKAKR